jgi:hypothetical protein
MVFQLLFEKSYFSNQILFGVKHHIGFADNLKFLKNVVFYLLTIIIIFLILSFYGRLYI